LLRIVIIGLGGIARKAYLPILTSRSDIELVVHSRSLDAVREIQAQYRIPHGANHLHEVLELEPAAAFVLSPAPTHSAIISPLLESGIDVFVEKPATQSARETQQLAELADTCKRVLMVGFNRRYAPLHQKARELWGDHTPSIVLVQKHRPDAWHPDLLEHFTEDMIHQIDLLRYFCGEARALFTVRQIEAGRLTGAISTVAFERGGFGQVVTSLKAGRWGENYAIHGDNISLYIDAFERVQYVTRETHETREETYASTWRTTLEGRGFVGQIEHFLDCCISREQPFTSAWESVKTQRLLESMVNAAESQP
jgi:virulence factor